MARAQPVPMLVDPDSGEVTFNKKALLQRSQSTQTEREPKRRSSWVAAPLIRHDMIKFQEETAMWSKFLRSALESTNTELTPFVPRMHDEQKYVPLVNPLDEEQRRIASCIIVSNIDYSVLPPQLEAVFSGKAIRMILMPRCLRSKYSLGVAFIEFWKWESAIMALSMNEILLLSKELQVSLLMDSHPSNYNAACCICVQNLPPSTGHKELFAIFQRFGKIVYAVYEPNENGEESATAYLMYGNASFASTARAEMDEAVVEGYALVVFPITENICNTIFEGNLDNLMNWVRQPVQITKAVAELQRCGEARQNKEEERNLLRHGSLIGGTVQQQPNEETAASNAPAAESPAGDDESSPEDENMDSLDVSVAVFKSVHPVVGAALHPDPPASPTAPISGATITLQAPIVRQTTHQTTSTANIKVEQMDLSPQ